MKIYEFTNISRFCVTMGLSRALVISVLSGKKRSKHKRWSLVENPIKRFLIERNDGYRVEIFNGELKAFCRENNIGSSQRFLYMLNGKIPYCKEWKLIKAYTPDNVSLEVIKLKQYNTDDILEPV